MSTTVRRFNKGKKTYNFNIGEEVNINQDFNSVISAMYSNTPKSTTNVLVSNPSYNKNNLEDSGLTVDIYPRSVYNSKHQFRVIMTGTPTTKGVFAGYFMARGVHTSSYWYPDYFDDTYYYVIEIIVDNAVVETPTITTTKLPNIKKMVPHLTVRNLQLRVVQL